MSKKIVLPLAFALTGVISVVASAADLVFDDGGSHVIDYEVEGIVTVLDGSRVEFLSGGRATTTEVYAGSIVNSGGFVGTVIVNDRDGPTSFRMSAGRPSS